MTATRIVRAGTLALLAALWLLAAASLWRTRVPAGLRPPRLDARAYFSASELRRAARHSEFLRLAWVGATLAQVLALVVLAARPPRLRGPALLRGAGLAAVVVVAAWLAALPFAAAAHWWDRRDGIARRGVRTWLPAQLPALAAQVAIGLVAACVLLLLARRLGRRWWIGAWPALVAIGVAVVALGPLVAGGRPLRDTALAAEVRRLARAEHVGSVRVEVERVHTRTRAANAEAVGVGPTRRIVFWDTLLDGRFTRPEVRVAAAHELAHIRRRHVWKGLAWFALLSLPGLYVVALATRRRGGLAEPRAVPLAALVLLCLQLALLPLTNAISRRYEVEADWIALETTRDPAAARGLFEGFAATDLTDPRPPAWSYVLLDDHPTLLQRIALTRAWRARLDRDDHRVERELDVDVEVVR